MNNYICQTLNLSFFLAKRYLLNQKGSFSSFIIRIAVLATALSVAVMILAIAFISGFKYEIRQKLFSFWGHIHITEFNPNASSLITASPIRLDSDLIQRVQAIPHVSQVAPYALRPVILQSEGTMEGIKLKGVNSRFKLSPYVGLTGNFPDFSDTAYSKQIVLSQTTANRLQLKTGDELMLYFLEPGATAPRIRKVMLSGIFHTGMEEVDKEFGICDIRLLQKINNWKEDNINGYQVDLDNPDFSDTLADLIFYDYINPPLTTTTMSEIYPNIFDWLQLQDVNAQIVLMIMAVVAVINLAVALLILIVEQSRMVGLLKALGMTYGGIRKIFLAHAAMIAGAGIIAGNIIGLAIAFLQIKTGFLRLSEATYYMSQVPVRIRWDYILLIDAATLAVCLACMLLPSLYIKNINPAKALQFR